MLTVSCVTWIGSMQSRVCIMVKLSPSSVLLTHSASWKILKRYLFFLSHVQCALVSPIRDKVSHHPSQKEYADFPDAGSVSGSKCGLLSASPGALRNRRCCRKEWTYVSHHQAHPNHFHWQLDHQLQKWSESSSTHADTFSDAQEDSSAASCSEARGCNSCC